MNEIIILDVGGVRFKTCRQTLCSDESSMLAKMYSPDSVIPPGIKTDDGAFFLDRTPEVFKEVLDYLRYGELSKDLSAAMLRKLKKEADFFLLDGLRKQIQIIYPEDDDLVELDIRGTTFTRTRRFLMKYQDHPKILGYS